MPARLCLISGPVPIARASDSFLFHHSRRALLLAEVPVWRCPRLALFDICCEAATCRMLGEQQTFGKTSKATRFDQRYIRQFGMPSGQLSL
jgi:hypothetical protein